MEYPPFGHLCFKIAKMIHLRLLLLILISSFQLHAQSISNLSIIYGAGYDCSQPSDNEDGYVRGGCVYRRTLTYSCKKNTFKTTQLESFQAFYEFDDGFQPNSFHDSIRRELLFTHRKIDRSELEALLLPVLQLTHDSLLGFNAADISDDEVFIAACKTHSAEVDTLLNASFLQFTFSTVHRDVSIDFDYNGKRYSIWKNDGNPFWILGIEQEELETVCQFIQTPLNALLMEQLPRRFSGDLSVNAIVQLTGLQEEIKKKLGISHSEE